MLLKNQVKIILIGVFVTKIKMNKKFQDIFDTPIQIGDIVAFNPPQYKGLVKGRVVGFTEKSVRICWANGGLMREDFCTRFPRDVVKCPN